MVNLEMLGEAIRRKKGVINKVDQDLDSFIKVTKFISANFGNTGIEFPNYLNLFSAGHHLRRRKQPYNKLYYQDTWFVRVCRYHGGG